MAVGKADFRSLKQLKDRLGKDLRKHLRFEEISFLKVFKERVLFGKRCRKQEQDMLRKRH